MDLLVTLVVLIHFLFIVFVIFGGVLVFYQPRIIFCHLPALAWGVLVQIMHWPCPLTPLEMYLRQQSGQGAYEEGFLQHYLLAVIYPEGLTVQVQLCLGGLLVLFNLLVYGLLFIYYRK